jgi:acyl-CoA reductase-like NAD-dependent aldehyde dehydrogenase
MTASVPSAMAADPPAALTRGPDVAARPAQATPALAARLARIAGETLPPELAHLAEGVFGEALAKAVDYAQTALRAGDGKNLRR